MRQRPESSLRLDLHVIVLRACSSRDLSQAGVQCSVILEEVRVADCVAGLLEKLTESFREGGGVLSAKKKLAIVDIDQTSSVVATLRVLGAGDDNVEIVSSLREESTGVTYRRGIVLVGEYVMNV
jgi:hypothetical protein